MGKYPISDQGHQVINLCVAFMVLPIIAVGLRFWSRAIIIDSKSRVERFWWDDWLILFNLPFTLVQNGLTIYWVTIGFGLHVTEVETNDLITGLQILYAGYSLYDVGISIAKLSVVCFYARVFNTNQGRFKLVLWIVAALVIIWPTSFVLTSLFQCSPVRKSWLPWIPGSCKSNDAVYISSAISSVVIDFIILVLPLPMLWRLQLRLHQKFLVTAVLFCGYVVIGISIGRLVTTLRFGDKVDEDVTFNLPKIGYWWIVECPVEIISACLPAIFTLLKRGVQQGPSALFRRTATRTTSKGETGRSWTGIRSKDRKKHSDLISDSNEELNYLGPKRYTANAYNNNAKFDSRDAIGVDSVAIRVRKDVEISTTNEIC